MAEAIGFKRISQQHHGEKDLAMTVGTLGNTKTAQASQQARDGQYVAEGSGAPGMVRPSPAVTIKLPHRLPAASRSPSSIAFPAPRSWLVRALPWTLSLAIHLGIAAVATLVALVVVERGRDLIIPGAVLTAEPLI